MDRLKRARYGRAALRTTIAVALVATFVSTARHVSLDGVVRVFASANVPLLSTLVPLVLAMSFALRAARFRALLGRGQEGRARFRDVLGSVVLSQGANNVLPLRAGELVRTRDFMARGYSIRRVAFAQLTEKLVELATLVAWTVPMLAHFFGSRRLVLGVLLLVVLLLPAGAWFGRRVRRPNDITSTDRTRDRLVSVAQAVLWSFSADGFEVALIAVCLASVGIPATLTTSLAVLAAVNLAILLPSTPGQIGTLEAGASLGLVLMGTPSNAAIGFALLYRCMQWVPVTIAAGLVWAFRRTPHDPRGDLRTAPWTSFLEGRP